MRNILIIAGHEIKRLRARFSARMMIAVLALLLSAAAVSFLVYSQGMIMARDIYSLGVSPGAPVISDQRFSIRTMDASVGRQMLRDRVIDAYITEITILYRQDDRSQQAVGAVKKHLEKMELARIAHEYPLIQAFPLRVEINYLKAPSENRSITSTLSLADIVNRARQDENLADSAVQGDAFEHDGATNNGTGTIPAASSPTDESVRLLVEGLMESRLIPEFKAEFASGGQVLVPSLMNPPIPLAQVLLAFAYILPIFFICIFFTSGFIEEKIGRKFNILLSTPVSPFQIIAGRMLPYIGYSLLIVIAITLILRGNLWLALAIFLPVILFIFAIYLGVGLQYRTFKDQTYFSMVAVTGITAYLVFPAMFVGVNDLSYISPLTLAVQMYRGIEITPLQYAISAIPMSLVFLLAVTVGVRVFNEEYLMSFKPLHIKLRDAIYLAMDKNHIAASVAVFSLLFIPVVFMTQVAAIAVAFNLPRAVAIGLLIFVCVVIEEAAKSLTVAVAIERELVKQWWKVAIYAAISAAFFFLGEKALLFVSLKVISESIFTTAVFATNLLWMPWLVHTVCTVVVCLVTFKTGIRGYPFALLAGAIIHGIYNLSIIGVFK